MNRKLLSILRSPEACGNTVLCRIVHSSGSTPRRDYPYMIVWFNGKITGTIGGGALEYKVIDKSKEVLSTGEPGLIAVDMNGKSIHSKGSLCGGSAIVLIEKFDAKQQQLILEISKLMDTGINPVIVTQVTIDDPISIVHHLTESTAENNLDIYADLLDKAFTHRRTYSKAKDDKILLCRYIHLPQVLHIFGGGHVGKAVAELAVNLDFDVLIYDDRADLVNLENMPQGVQISNDSLKHLQNTLSFDHHDLVLVTTRNHQFDLQIMSWLIDKNPGYLGLMSSRRKWIMIKNELEQSGSDKSKIDRICSPVGLYIASETVPEIAISIMAEIVLMSKTGKKSNISMSTGKNFR